MSTLLQLQSSFPQLIGDVRGLGMFVGLDIVSCPQRKTPAPVIAKTLKEGAKARRVLLSTDGPAGNVIKVKPPLVFGMKEVDHMAAVMR